jgi:hypothetical protein
MAVFLIKIRSNTSVSNSLDALATGLLHVFYGFSRFFMSRMDKKTPRRLKPALAFEIHGELQIC